MYRRQFLSLVPVAAASAQGKKKSRGKKQEVPPPPPPPETQVKEFFLEITRGYLRNAAKTSPSMAAVEYPNATITKNFLAKSGLSVTGVTRMMPAMAAWVAGGREPGLELTGALISAFRNGCNPRHADYWQAAAPKPFDQRQVESSIVAWTLWLMRDRILPAVSEEDRRNIAAWLASCTQHPVRTNNWALFTAVNIAARMRLSEKWPEFQADEQFMLDDLKVIESMATGDSGWYNDGLTGTAYDYYNSWVFASHFLYWNELVGSRYPEISKRFSERLSRYLETAPLFFAGHGGHVLYGRSLIYRWGVLTPLVLAYQQKLWPHSPGLLRRIVNQNILYHASIGGFDAEAGKLRETYTPEGSPAIKESYIDGGHPYWGMQAFAFWRIPDADPFWTAPEEPLPVEKSDYAIALPEPGMLITGRRSSGQVRIFNAKSTREDVHYRDKYNKLAYSSHFCFAANHDKTHAPIDDVLALRDTRTGETAIRGEITSSNIDAEKIEMDYSIRLGAVTAQVHTEIPFLGEFESRLHNVTFSGGPLEGIELVEGGSAYSTLPVYKEAHLKTWSLKGWKKSGREDATGSVLFAQHQVQTLTAPAEPKLFLASMRYQSPKALPKDKIDGEASQLLSRLRL
ncbi:DUF2264 domain-containing protein [uncultured Paludibaculum sp.]|uniref:DUF2264 domain-containing protein n=1 Tax=uncultured Paludibaculum sp. TaxID=1765020 RepID=UPI002AAA8A56|nr:DUF2264 domain-containing protein [uncultured Paludibaculum sp.]